MREPPIDGSNELPVEPIDYRFANAPSLTVTTWLGDDIDIAVEHIRVSAERVDLTGTMNWEAWHSASLAGAFHLDLVDAEGLAEPGHDVIIVMTLRSPYLAVFDDADEVIAEIFSDPTPLQETEAWLLCEARQVLAVPGASDATTEVGFQTLWADGQI